MLNTSTDSINMDVSEKFQKSSYIQNSDTLQYQILLPKGFNPNKKYPLVLFLHGAGERGIDNKKQLTHGGSLFTNAENLDNFPCIAVFPQCPPSEMWTTRKKVHTASYGTVFSFDVEKPFPKSSQMVNQLVNALSETSYVDAERLYIMGISMGGIGALEHLYRYPAKYAAAAVICGGHDANLAKQYANTPIWFFHGAQDDVVQPELSQDVFDVVKKQNAQSKYSLYPYDNHNSWDSALAEPNLLEWIFNYKK